MYIVLGLSEKLNTLMCSLEVSHGDASSVYIKMCLEESQDTLGSTTQTKDCFLSIFDRLLDESEVQILHVLSSACTLHY